MIREEELYGVGKFQKTHALKGELNMICDIDPEYFIEGNPMIVDFDGIFVPYYAESIRPKGSTSYLVKIEDIDGEQASEFVNKEIFILKKDAEVILEEELDELSPLIGYEIYDKVSQTTLGTIESIDDSTVNILFIVRNANGEEYIVPANEDFIENINDEAKLLEMRLPEGLLDINA